MLSQDASRWLNDPALLFHNHSQIHCDNKRTPSLTLPTYQQSNSSTLQHLGEEEGRWPNFCYKQVFIKDKEGAGKGGSVSSAHCLWLPGAGEPSLLHPCPPP